MANVVVQHTPQQYAWDERRTKVNVDTTSCAYCENLSTMHWWQVPLINDDSWSNFNILNQIFFFDVSMSTVEVDE